jgi:hypothetical protein
MTQDSEVGHTKTGHTPSMSLKRSLSHQPNARLVASLSALSLLAACSGDGGEPNSSGASEVAGFSSGTADVIVTGDIEATLDLPLAQDRESWFRDGRVSLAWKDSEGNYMAISASPKGGKADARSDETPLVATFVVDDQSFSSEATRTCAASFEQLTSQAVRGTLTCSQMRLPMGGSFGAVDIEATFSTERA